MQPESEAVPELQSERRELVAEAELGRLRPDGGHLVGADARPYCRDRGVHPLACLGVRVLLARCRTADTERAVVAGPVAVERVDDVEERLIARPDQPVGEVVRMRVAALARDRVDRLDLVGAHLDQPLAGQGDDLVLAYAGFQRLDDVLVDAVDHRGRLREQHDLVGRLELPGVEHQLLAVDDREPLALHLEEECRLHDVDPDRRVGDSGVGE